MAKLETREEKAKKFLAKAKPGESLEIESKKIGDSAVTNIRKVVTKL